MSNAETRKLQDWIAELLGRAGEASGRLVKMVMVHVVNGTRLGDEVRTFAVPPEADEEWSKTAAEKVWTKAVAEAEALGKARQTYAVQAFFAESSKAADRYVFSIAVDAPDPSSLTTEPPTAEGIAAQGMRMGEFFAGLHAQSHLSSMRELQSELKSLRLENAELRSERIKAFKVMEEVYSQAAERERDRRRDEFNQRIIQDGVDKLSLLVPTALNQIAGRQILPEQSGTLVLLLKSFVESVTPEDLQRWAGTMRPELMAAFIQLATTVSPPKPSPTSSPATTNGAAK